MNLLLIIIGSLFLLVLVSFGVEALRRRPNAPTTLYWDPRIQIHKAIIAGNTIRYIKTGTGPNLLLLHTLRTQLDIFEKLAPPFEVVHGLRGRLPRARLFGHS